MEKLKKENSARMKASVKRWEESGEIHKYRLAQRKALLGKHGFGKAARGRLDHSSAKWWSIRSPFGEIFEFSNLREWARQNVHRFEDDRPAARMPFWARIACGLKNIYMPKRANAPTTYKGWTTLSISEGERDLLGRDQS